MESPETPPLSTNVVEGVRPRAVAWSFAACTALWAPLLALSIAYPSVEQVLFVPSLRRAVLFTIAVWLSVVVALALPSGFAARAVGRWFERPDLAPSAANCGASAASAIFLGYAAMLVSRGPTRTLTGDVRGLLLVLLAASLMGAMVGALSLLEVRRSERTWIPLAGATAATALWAFLARMLIRGTSSIDTPVYPWAIALGAALIGAASMLGTRRRLAVLAGVVVLLGSFLPAIRLRPRSPEPAPSGTPRPGAPNVVVVLIDTWRYDMTGFADPRLATTPRLQALAAERSTVFTTAIAPAAATVPSVKAMITGFPASHFGLPGWGRMPPPPTAWTMARAFRESGYRTSAFVASDLIQAGGFETGFEEYWCASAIGNVERSFFLQVLVARRDYWRAQRLAEELRVFKTRGEVVVDRFTRWVDGNGDRPFFTYIHLIEPHWPYEDRGHGLVPKELRGLKESYSHAELERLEMGNPANAKYRRTPALREMVARYQEEMRDADRLIGTIADALASRGKLDDTILIVVGDHGEEFFEHNGYGHGQDVYEEIVHVPLVIRWPRSAAFTGFAPRITDPVSLIDVFPTLTDLLALPAPRRPFAGRSLRGDLAGRTAAPSGIFSETLWGKAHVSYRLGDLKARVVFDSQKLPGREARVRLFDLAADPRELKPIREVDEKAAVFLRAAHKALTAQWTLALEATTRESPAKPVQGKGTDEALERLRALGYLR